MTVNQVRKRTSTILIVLIIGGCTTAHPIYDDKGDKILMVECGASTSMSICYDRAAKECPSGYRMVSEESGFNRKTLKVQCKQPSNGA